MGVQQVRRLTAFAVAALSLAVLAATEASAAPARLGPPAVTTGSAPGATARRPPATGVVVIETDLAHQGSSAAGTGFVITPGGRVLTNNHVIRGATTIRVVVPASGRSYTARVLGYSISADVAVLQLDGAAGLATVALGSSSALQVGQPVTAVGNAGGTGAIVTASGTR